MEKNEHNKKCKTLLKRLEQQKKSLETSSEELFSKVADDTFTIKTRSL